MRAGIEVAALLLGLTVLGVAACGAEDGPTALRSLNEEDLPGSYSATHWAVLPSPGDTTDVLAQGGSLVLLLTADGSTSGQMLIPAGELAPERTNLELDGTWEWRETSGQVSLSLESGSFLHGMALDVEVVNSRLTLYGQRPVPGGAGHVRVVLSRP